MPTHKSNALKDIVVLRLEREIGPLVKIRSRYRIYRINDARVNLRVTTRKSGDKYWFDVTPIL